MYYDNQRRTVRKLYNENDELTARALAATARCPECDGELVARRCTKRIWHWAHKGERPASCTAGESVFHLTIKAALEEEGWTLESSFDRWRFDAVATSGYFVVAEVVHSLSGTYYDKAKWLQKAGLGDRQLWILDQRESYGRWDREFGWTRLANYLEDCGATVWWVGDTIVDAGGQESYDHPDLLARLHAYVDDVDYDYIRNNLDKIIAKRRIKRVVFAPAD